MASLSEAFVKVREGISLVAEVGALILSVLCFDLVDKVNGVELVAGMRCSYVVASLVNIGLTLSSFVAGQWFRGLEEISPML
jgi:hypothetical protein